MSKCVFALITSLIVSFSASAQCPGGKCQTVRQVISGTPAIKVGVSVDLSKTCTASGCAVVHQNSSRPSFSAQVHFRLGERLSKLFRRCR